METENDIAIPKIFVFDNIEQDESVGTIKYINTAGIVNNFRVKIVFDVSVLGSDIFVPPEVHSYKCMIFDKEHFANFEV